MKKNIWTVPLIIFMLMTVIGIVLILFSFIQTALEPFSAKGIRALGLFCLLLGTGEFLNHPLQKKLIYDEQNSSGPQISYHRRRNPCAIGNSLDVLALICFFVGMGFFFFPYTI